MGIYCWEIWNGVHLDRRFLKNHIEIAPSISGFVASNSTRRVFGQVLFHAPTRVDYVSAGRSLDDAWHIMNFIDNRVSIIRSIILNLLRRFIKLNLSDFA